MRLDRGALCMVFGWSWGTNRPRRDAVRFSIASGLLAALTLLGGLPAIVVIPVEILGG